MCSWAYRTPEGKKPQTASTFSLHCTPRTLNMRSFPLGHKPSKFLGHHATGSKLRPVGSDNHCLQLIKACGRDGQETTGREGREGGIFGLIACRRKDGGGGGGGWSTCFVGKGSKGQGKHRDREGRVREDWHCGSLRSWVTVGRRDGIRTSFFYVVYLQINHGSLDKVGKSSNCKLLQRSGSSTLKVWYMAALSRWQVEY
ncbi:hypothetical protein HDK90DRAFT_187886 [Phyllosticta capitalensis]|uniref:Uncharacterized protein n=1 Tax=Phyllosticta capitalensis TaxID=121624 RepID=A0ABR1YWI3_9PEZI